METDNLYRSMLDHLPNPVLVHDLEGVVHYANSAGQALIGFSPGGIVPFPIGHVFPPSEIPGMVERAARRRQGETRPFHYQTRLLNQKGHSVIVDVTSTMILDDPANPLVMIVCHDIPNPPQSRTAELEAERHRLQAILDATGEGIYYTEDTTIAYVNPAFCAMTGYTARELIGQSTALLIGRMLDDSLDQHWSAVRAKLLEDRLYRSEGPLVRKDGTTFEGAFTLSLVGQAGEMVQIVTQVRDISQQKHLEALKSRFIASAAHELRTPITNLNIRTYLMRHQPEQVFEHLRLLEESIARLGRLAEHLLDLSRYENGVMPLRLTEVLLQDLVQGVVDLQQVEAQQKGITLRTDFPAAPIVLLMDESRILQVVVNLIVNALKYTETGGDVFVELFTCEGQYAEEAVLSVQDTGPGIAPEHLPHIFEPFYRVTKDGRGTGLGLSIAHEIVKQHHGFMTVESTFGQGSRFMVHLPITRAEIPMRD